MSRLHYSLGVAALCVFGALDLHAQGRSSTATVEVIGGPHTGSYTLASPPDVGCMISERAGKPKKFSVNFGIPESDARSKDPRALTFVVASIRDASGTGPAPAADYEASLSFGPVMDTKNGTFYMSGSNPTSGRKGGSGTVRLEDHGKDARVVLDLQPQPGVAVKGIVSCTNVLRY